MIKLRDVFKNTGFIFIAEIGLNHNGNYDIAGRMIEKAANSGAHAVKFQTFDPADMNSVYTASLVKYGAEREKSLSEADFFKKYTLEKDEYIKLKKSAESRGMVFFSSPFDVKSVDLLEDIDVKIYKVASSEVTNHILLERIARTNKCVMMSTGISTEEEIALAVDLLKKHGTPDIVLLHCVSLYPLPPENANLRRIITLRERFSTEVGFSDHSRDFRTVEFAAVLGARIFEKHFTLGPDHDCPDREVSLDPAGFRKMAESAELAGEIMGDGHISYNSAEKEVAKMARRSLYATRPIPRGKKLEMNDIVPKRPGVGIPVYRLDSILGRKSNRDIEKDFLLRPEYFD